MSEKPEKQYVEIEDFDFPNEQDEDRIKYDKEGMPLFLNKPHRSEIDDLIEDGMIEDENGEWND